MSEQQSLIGTDAQGNPVIFTTYEREHALLFGGSDTDRRIVLGHLARSIPSAGISVLMTDTSGSLSGLAEQVPATLWDLHGVSGLPLRTTVTELGPLLTARLLGLNEEQSELLLVAFKLADDHSLLLIDAKDLKALLNEMRAHASDYEEEYGSFDRQTISGMIHKIVVLEANGADSYLFEPAIDVHDFLTAKETQTPRVHLLDARTQEEEKTLYSSYLLFLMGEFCENLPDILENDPDKLVVMIDEAQLLLNGLNDSLLRRLRQLLEKLAEKGIRVVLSFPEESDLPSPLSALSWNRMQIDRGDNVVRSSSESGKWLFPENAGAGDLALNFDPSLIKDNAAPLSSQRRTERILQDPLHEKYKIPFDRDSAYEFLKRRGLAEPLSDNAPTPQPEENSNADSSGNRSGKEEQSNDKDSLQKMARQAKSSAKSLGNTVAGTVGRQVGKKIGSSFGDFGETLGGNIGASLGRGIINTLFTK